MITRKKAERVKDSKSANMLECFPEEEIQKCETSPRVINTHIKYRYFEGQRSITRAKGLSSCQSNHLCISTYFFRL